MKQCRCMKEMENKGHVNDMCFIPCDIFIKSMKDKKDREAQKESDRITSKPTNNELKKKALERIQEMYPDTYQNRTDYKMIKHNIDE